MHESTDESFYPGPCPAGHWALKSNESLVQAPTELQCWMGPINILYTYYIPWFTYCSMTHTRISQWKWGYQLHKRTMAGITYQSILLSASRGRSRSLCDCGLGSACRWIWWAYSATQSRPHCPPAMRQRLASADHGVMDTYGHQQHTGLKYLSRFVEFMCVPARSKGCLMNFKNWDS